MHLGLLCPVAIPKRPSIRWWVITFSLLYCMFFVRCYVFLHIKRPDIFIYLYVCYQFTDITTRNLIRELILIIFQFCKQGSSKTINGPLLHSIVLFSNPVFFQVFFQVLKIVWNIHNVIQISQLQTIDNTKVSKCLLRAEQNKF